MHSRPRSAINSSSFIHIFLFPLYSPKPYRESKQSAGERSSCPLAGWYESSRAKAQCISVSRRRPVCSSRFFFPPFQRLRVRLWSRNSRCLYKVYIWYIHTGASPDYMMQSCAAAITQIETALSCIQLFFFFHSFVHWDGFCVDMKCLFSFAGVLSTVLWLTFMLDWQRFLSRIKWNWSKKSLSKLNTFVNDFQQNKLFDETVKL